MPTTREELDKIAERYHESDALQDKHIEDESQFYTYDWVLHQLTGATSVLEMGYGEGNFTAELLKRGFNPVVLEGSGRLVESARAKHGPSLRLVHSLFEEYRPEAPFERIVATHVLEHVDDPVALLKIMKDWLTPNGEIIAIVPNKESLHRRLAVQMGLQPELDTLSARDHFVGHQRVYSLDTLRTDVERAGLKVTDEAGFFLKVVPNSMMLTYPLELIKSLNAISPELPPNLLANIGVIIER